METKLNWDGRTPISTMENGDRAILHPGEARENDLYIRESQVVEMRDIAGAKMLTFISYWTDEDLPSAIIDSPEIPIQRTLRISERRKRFQ